MSAGTLFSAIIYEMLGHFDDAYIDYKKALEIVPDNTYLQKDVLRLDRKINFNQNFDTSR